MERGQKNPKSGGSAGIKGVEYQLNVSIMFLLNALLQLKGTAWELWMEHTDGGKLDDVVLKAPKNNIFLQAKSREDKKKRITLDDLHSTNSKKDKFSLAKYFFSYLNIKRKVDIKNLVLCTNAEVHEKVSKYLIAHRVPPESLLHCTCDNCDNYSFYTFNKDILPISNLNEYLEKNLKGKGIDKDDITDTNILDFFEVLQFYPNYPPDSKLAVHIEQLLYRLKLSDNLFGKTSFEDVHNKIKELFKQPKRGPLQETQAKAIFAEIRSDKFCETLKNYETFFSRNDIKIGNQKQVSVITTETGYLLHLLKVFQALKEEHDKVLFMNPYDNINVQSHIVEAFKEPKYTTLVIVCPKHTESSIVYAMCRHLQEALTSRSYKNVILITEFNNSFAKQIILLNSDNYNNIESLVAFTDFSNGTREKLLKVKNINFQGAAINLEELLVPVAVTDFEKSLCYEILEDLVKEVPILIGTEVQGLKEDVEHYYVTRNFKRQEHGNAVIYSENEILSVQEKMVLINDCAGMGKSTILTKLATEIKKNFPRLWVILLKFTACSRILQDALNKRKSIHIEELLDTPLDTDFKKSIFSIDEKVVLLLDGVDEISPDYTDLIVNLLIQCQKASNFAKIFVTTRPHLCQTLMEKLGVTPFTLEPFTEEKQANFLTSYWTFNLKLEDKDKNKCKSYALLLLKEVSLWFCVYGQNDFGGTPLLVRMLAEIFQESNKSLRFPFQWMGCKEFLSGDRVIFSLLPVADLSRLYTMFVEKQRQVFFEKVNPGGNAAVNLIFDKLFDECLACHEILAVENIFRQEVCRYFTSYKLENCNMEILLKIGIIQEWNGKYQFAHRTFAEFFFAKSLVREIQNRDTTMEFKNFLINCIIQNCPYSDNTILDFFNRCLEEVIDSIPSDFFLNYESQKYKIHMFAFKESILLINYLIQRDLIFILKFLLNCLSDGESVVENRRRKRVFLDEYCKANFERHSEASNPFKILRQVVKEGGINIINHDRSFLNGAPIHIATRDGILETIKFLVNHGANVCLEDAIGDTPLMIAAKYGHFHIVKFLLESDELIEPGNLTPKTEQVAEYINAQNKDGKSALSNAASNGYLDIFKLLVQKGANVAAKSKYGDTILHAAALGGSSGMVEFLLQQSLDVEAENINGGTALRNAVSEGHLEIIKLLCQNSADINTKNKFGYTLFHEVFLTDQSGIVVISLSKHDTDVSEKRLKLVKLLVQNGADINAKTTGGDTVLHLAASRGELNIVNFLVEHGIDINIKNDNGETALHRTVCHYHDHYLEIFKLLVGKGADVNVKNNSGETLLHLAISISELDFINFLLESGMDIDIKNENGDTALHKTVSERRWRTFEFIIQKGADVNVKNNNGDTVLHAAAFQGSWSVVKILLEHGAKVNVKNQCGFTPLDIADGCNYPGLVKLLMRNS